MYPQVHLGLLFGLLKNQEELILDFHLLGSEELEQAELGVDRVLEADVIGVENPPLEEVLGPAHEVLQRHKREIVEVNCL